MKHGFEVRLPILFGGEQAEGIYSSRAYAQMIADGANAILFTSPMPGTIPSIMEIPYNADAPELRMRHVAPVKVPDDFIFADYDNA